MKDTLVSFVVVIIGQDSSLREGETVVEGTPYWEYPAAERNEAITQCVVAWCNNHGTTPESVIVRAIAT